MTTKNKPTMAANLVADIRRQLASTTDYDQQAQLLSLAIDLLRKRQADRMAAAAKSGGPSHEEQYRAEYADCAEPGADIPTLDIHREEIEETRSQPWYQDSAARIQHLDLLRECRDAHDSWIQDFESWSSKAKQIFNSPNATSDQIALAASEATEWMMMFGMRPRGTSK